MGRRPSPALVIACIALFVALGGTGYAALKLPKNSVGSKQIKKNAVSSSKVKNRSLKAVDFKTGQLPAGPQGPQGVQGLKGDKGDDGDQGLPGPGAQWALVSSDGEILSQSGGISMAATAAPGGYYLNFGTSVAGRAVLGLGANDGGFDTIVTASPCGGDPGGNPASTKCNPDGTDNPNHLYVQTFAVNAAGYINRAFYIAVLR